MTVDLSPLDAKIRKFQKLKELLSDTETRELLADPEIRLLIQQTVRTNGSFNNLEPMESGEHLATQRKLRAGSQLAEVFEATKSFPDRFKVGDIVEEMKNRGYNFEAKKPDIAVNSALRKLATWKFIRLIKKGRGRRPHVFTHART